MDCNRLLKFSKDNKDIGLQYLLCFFDAGFSTRNDGNSQHGYVLMLVNGKLMDSDEEDYYHILDWRSFKTHGPLLAQRPKLAAKLAMRSTLCAATGIISWTPTFEGLAGSAVNTAPCDGHRCQGAVRRLPPRSCQLLCRGQACRPGDQSDAGKTSRTWRSSEMDEL